MPEPADVVIGVYAPEESPEALELEKRCVQGASYRMSFRRSSFHRRAENYPESRIFTARVAGRLVGLTAAAIKDVVLRGEPARASFFFDARVDPGLRGQGIGRLLGEEALAWASPRSSFGYTYTLADNRVAAHLASSYGVEAAGYSYMIIPVFRRATPGYAAGRASFEEVHAAMLASSPPFDLYTNPDCRPGRGGYLESWIVRKGRDHAGCSVWSNRGILGEVIEAIPVPMRIAAWLTRAPLIRARPWPHFPAPGEELRSWYLFDFFATDPALGRDLMRQVANQALDHSIDYCYLPHYTHDAWSAAVRADLPRLFAPVIPYRMLVKRSEPGVRPIERAYVDVRDL
jgi:GNAT superfamily N-acetyltransferase